MAITVDSTGDLSPEEQKRLKGDLSRSLRQKKIRAILLVAPLVAFILVTFIFPIGNMLVRSVDNPQVHTYMPNVTEALKSWDGQELPDETIYAALAKDLIEGRKAKTIGKAATRLNYEKSGMRSLITGTARKHKKIVAPYKESLIGIKKKWGDIDTWKIIKKTGSPVTGSFFINAFDMVESPDGEISFAPEKQQIYLKLFWRTVWMSLLITFMTVLLGYPVSFLLASLPMKTANILMILVLLPFWTSLLVRTSSWIALLQTEGILNDLLVWLGVISNEARVQMIYNAIGTVVAMTHILLPFMILPLYSVMKTVPPSYVRAARSLGATNWTAFWRVYVPQTVPGVSAGAILVFILSIGYYITPALVGGESGRFIGNMIAYHMQKSLNWGLAAALGVMLLVMVLAIFALYSRVVGDNKVKLG
ncbi:ABC transporter permease [Kiloniella litopenaei]|uniref:ABC transporter permease n=1 Tax=Kiloniella litopenaei TaxID=1549748 RepID=A0A0M2RFT9_9PROT|nr:ABC transporter permease [Kiloniella litopenaei]KKJ78428.1 ABC transporter permease [Kiloniella litopenaei]